MRNVKRDTQIQSRKGRPAINGQAMTAAERKRRQRERQRTEQSEAPSWLRLRQRIWKLMQEQFILANADELAEALSGVSAAIAHANVMAMAGLPRETITKAPRALIDPSNADLGLFGFFPSLAPYEPSIAEQYHGRGERQIR